MMSALPSRIWPVLGAISALAMIFLAWWKDYPLLAIPGAFLLLRLVVAQVNAADQRREHARVAAILDEAFADRPAGRPDFTLRGTMRGRGFDLVFKTPADIREAEQDGSLQRVMERARSLYGMHVAFDVSGK